MSELGISSWRYPRGWFCVGWSADLKVGDVQSLNYFGKRLVAWRGASGEVAVQDAFCLHLGADRGVRGWVSGDDLTCPWHGWTWNGEGYNTGIPYGAEKCKPNLRIEAYPVREWCGMIMAWYDWEPGATPTWDLPEIPEFEDPSYYPLHPFADRLFTVNSHVQMPLENATDFSHVHFVHGASEMPELTSFQTEEHLLSSSVKVLYGGGKKATKLTPDGPLYAEFRSTFSGIGVAVIRWELPVPSVQITMFTAIDGKAIHYFSCQTCQRTPGDEGNEPTGRSRAMIETQLKVIPQDFFIWENMTYQSSPKFAREEAKSYADLRRWAKQFYPSEAQWLSGSPRPAASLEPELTSE